MRMNIKHFSLIFSVVGILLLYFVSVLSQPIQIGLNELPEYEGKQVIVEGFVIDYYVTSYGSQIIKIKDNRTGQEGIHQAIIFVEGKITLEYGDKIQATGKVQKYKDEWEIVVSSQSLIQMLQKWQNISFPLWQLAENPEAYIGTNVNVTGCIDKLYSTYFYLADLEKQQSILVLCKSSSIHNFSVGDGVCVAAKFVYDENNFQYHLEITEGTHGISIMDEG